MVWNYQEKFVTKPKLVIGEIERKAVAQVCGFQTTKAFKWKKQLPELSLETVVVILG